VCELFRITEMLEHKFSVIITIISSFIGLSETLPGKAILV